MPTIQRLLTDETGQSLVTAINNIVAAVKPNATEIQMGANDTTTVAEAINTQNQALSNVKDSLYTAYSNSWVNSLSVNLPKQGAYLFASQRYAQITILMRFQNGNTTASNISGNNWTFTNGTNGNITATASNQADYYIIPLVPTM